MIARTSDDVEIIDIKGHTKQHTDDLPGMITTCLTSINWKIAFFIFIIATLIFSDVFVECVLSNMKDAVDGDAPNTRGTMIQILFLVIFYIVIDLLVQGELI